MRPLKKNDLVLAVLLTTQISYSYSPLRGEDLSPSLSRRLVMFNWANPTVCWIGDVAAVII